MDVDETNADAAELIRDYWEAVGVEVDLKTVSGRIDQSADASQRVRRPRVTHRPHAGAAFLHPQLHAVRHYLQRVGAEMGRVVPVVHLGPGREDRSRAAAGEEPPAEIKATTTRTSSRWKR